MKKLSMIVVILAFLYSYAGAMSSSKLSIHTSMGSNSWEVIQNGKPRIVKLLDSFDSASKIKQTVPGIVIIGRIYLANQPMNVDPTQAAQNWWISVQSTILAYPDVDYWEGYNEPAIGSISDMQWYSQFEIARTNTLAQNNRKSCIGSFSTGTPDVTNPSIIQAFYPAIDSAIQHKGILGVHEYAAPYVNSTFSGSVESGSGWLTGRYRMLYNNFLIPTGRKINLAITENGIDGGTCSITNCNIAGGWKNFCGFWAQNGLTDCNGAYLNQLIWYDQVMRCDSYVLGSTIFSLEIPGWDSFDISPLTTIFTNYLSSNKRV